jgi:hypothetical protein
MQFVQILPAPVLSLDLFLFADMHGLCLEIGRRTDAEVKSGMIRYIFRFNRVEVVEGANLYTSEYGAGRTVREAACDYARRIANQTLRVYGRNSTANLGAPEKFTVPAKMPKIKWSKA